jgi:translation initiation factor 1
MKTPHAASLSSLSSLSQLGQLSGLVVKQTAPISEVELAAAAESAVSTEKVQRAKDIVRVHRETKGRGGKAVTLVKGISLPLAELEALGKQLKAACGSGGTVKDRVIEVQGDHCDKVVTLLNAQGYQAKKAGG